MSQYYRDLESANISSIYLAVEETFKMFKRIQKRKEDFTDEERLEIYHNNKHFDQFFNYQLKNINEERERLEKKRINARKEKNTKR